MKPRISNDLEHEEEKNIHSEQQEEKRIQKNEGGVRSLWDNFKHTNIHIIGVPEENRESKKLETLFEKIMTGNFPNLVKEIDIQVQEVHKVPKKMNPKRPAPRHIIIKMPKVKDKERILKATREKQLVTYNGAPIRLSADCTKETLQARRDWQKIFRVMKGRTYNQDYSTQQSYHLESKDR